MKWVLECGSPLSILTNFLFFLGKTSFSFFIVNIEMGFFQPEVSELNLLIISKRILGISSVIMSQSLKQNVW